MKNVNLPSPRYFSINIASYRLTDLIADKLSYRNVLTRDSGYYAKREMDHYWRHWRSAKEIEDA